MNTTRIQELVALLNAAARAYYNENHEIMSDYEYDKLYDELVKLESDTGIVLVGSPTRKVGYEVVGSLTKVPHDAPMLSLDKTKDPNALAAFLQEQTGLLSWKLDGLSIIIKYENGELQQALTRGNGVIGEDVTHNAKVFANIPLFVPYKGRFAVRGEAVIPFADFEAINAEEEIKYKNPRNLCSGTVRQLSNEVAAKRRVLFYAFALLPGAEIAFTLKSEQLAWLSGQGFDLTEYKLVTSDTVIPALNDFKNKVVTEPIASDGLVLTYDDITYSESLGATSKFPRDSLAFKWQDEIAETTLLDIEWNTSRTGLINPVAIFEPVDIEGTQVSRASLHNVSILRGLALSVGDRIAVYKANMIIPQVAENLTRIGEGIKIPDKCPVCDGSAVIVGDPETLYCSNPSCDAKKLQALCHFVSRDAMNIAGLSEQTLEKFLSQGYIRNYTDLFYLSSYENEITNMEGFGQKSYDNLIIAIEACKNVALPNFIYALGILHVGLANAKLLCAHFKHDPVQIAEVCKSDDYLESLLEIKGFGEAISHSLHEYFSQEKNMELYHNALEILHIQTPALSAELPLNGLAFVITGEVNQFANRKALQAFIETNGGRVSGSVSAKTSFLINNDATSTSGKNKKAAELGVPILTENDFIKRFGL
ncbi:MAG: NAD-dependent DNA ligase LigA [Firmicutes bacterium]|nr:NAD-dependent DNA ligase LigA [Bacillota bacterium]